MIRLWRRGANSVYNYSKRNHEFSNPFRVSNVKLWSSIFFLDCFGLILTLTRYNVYLPTFPFNLEKWQHWVCDSNSLLTFLHIFLLAYLLCGQKSTEKIVKVQLLYTAWKHNTIFLLKNAYLSSTKTMLLCWSHDSINNKLKKYLVMYVFFRENPKLLGVFMEFFI